MKKILEALGAAFWVASLILFIFWLITLDSAAQSILGRVSGWWWFSTTVCATFLTEYNSK